MKKTLIAAALMCAFTGSAAAAQVELYGVVDLGLSYTHMDPDNRRFDDVDRFSMDSGVQSKSRWGLKGVEDLGNGLKVGFILESGFEADSGEMIGHETDTLFDRESSLFIEGSFGKLGFGKLGSFNQGYGSWGLGDRLSPFGTDFGDLVVQPHNLFTGWSGWDNAIAYQTPDFAGFKFYVMYFMGDNGYENESSSDRMLNIAATYDRGAFSGMLSFEWYNYQSAFSDGILDVDDGWTALAGVSYDFGPIKLYLSGEYFDSAELRLLGGLFNQSMGYVPWVDGNSQPASSTVSFVQLSEFCDLVY